MVVARNEHGLSFPAFKVPSLSYNAYLSFKESPRLASYQNLPRIEPNTPRPLWPENGDIATARDHPPMTPRLETTNQMYGAFSARSPRVAGAFGDTAQPQFCGSLPKLNFENALQNIYKPAAEPCHASPRIEPQNKPDITKSIKFNGPDKRYAYYETEAESALKRYRGEPFGRPRSNFQPTMRAGAHYVVDPEWVSERCHLKFGGEKKLIASSRILPASSRARMHGYDQNEVQKVATPRCPVQPGWNYM